MTNTAQSPEQTLKIYDFPKSGHAHRARLMASLLALPYETIPVDLVDGEQKGEAYLNIIPSGQVPALDDSGTIVWDSTAILVYLAKKYGDESWLPEDPEGAALVQRFLSIASGEVFRGPCCARLITVFGYPLDHEQAKTTAKGLFDLLEAHLAGRAFLAAEHRTIADVACYSYIAHAPEGDVSLAEYPNIRRWLNNVEALPGFVAMPETKICLAQ
ncbi:MAG: glutathione S-transferase [Motiliproteus sp.]|nr:glutathione S-transferase [Motiliproteus sp.]MCW9051050.1 glutathione S-transferase [Motiliproteus sp.]